MSGIDELGYTLLIDLEFYFWMIQIFTFAVSYRSPNVRFIILITIFYRLSGLILPPILDYFHIFSYLVVAAINLAVIYSISRRKKVAMAMANKTEKINYLSSFFKQSANSYRRTTSELSIMIIYLITAVYFVLAFIESAAFMSLRYLFDIEMFVIFTEFFYSFHFVINSFEMIIFLALTFDGIKNFYGDNTIKSKANLN